MEVFHEIFHELIHAFLETAKITPFLFLSYLLMELIEHKWEEKAQKIISSHGAGLVGPIVGSGLGMIPQCGFSAAASGLFVGGVIPMGTLLAVFLSTSDEMLPIMISKGTAASTLIPILVIKIIAGITVGTIVNIIFSQKRASKTKAHEISHLCEHDGCNCKDSLWRSAITHTIQIALFILAATITINIMVYFIGKTRISDFLGSMPILGEAIAALIGLIPNCAPSVILTELYLDGIISSGAMMSGLLSSAGVGTLVLFKANKNIRENLLILTILYLSSLLFGIVTGFII